MKDVSAVISSEPLDFRAAQAFVSDPAYGAIDIFLGVVRNNHQGQAVTGITYDVHETLAEAELLNIYKEAKGIWPEAKCYVSHYQGYLPVGGVSVLIAISTPHREGAFEMCRYFIEEIKKRVPVWKKEHYQNGTSEWLPGHSLVTEAEEQTVCCGRCGSHG